MRDITDVFLHILHQYGSVDMAEAEFKKMINEDSELRTEYGAMLWEVVKRTDSLIFVRSTWIHRSPSTIH